MDDYRSALAVAHSHPWSCVLCPQPPGDPKCLASCTEIGIGLTGAGLLFMVLGMMMFFDKGLLAMGNVRRVPGGPRLDLAVLLCSRPPASASADPVPRGCHDDHRHEQDLPLLLPEAQAQRCDRAPPERADTRLATSLEAPQHRSTHTEAPPPPPERRSLPPRAPSHQAPRASWAASG